MHLPSPLVITYITQIRNGTTLHAKGWGNNVPGCRDTLNDCNELEIVALEAMLLFLILCIKELFIAVLPASAHLNSLFVHIPYVLGRDATRETRVECFQLVKVVIYYRRIEIACTLQVKLSLTLQHRFLSDGALRTSGANSRQQPSQKLPWP